MIIQCRACLGIAKQNEEPCEFCDGKGYIATKPNFKFGDIIENEWASEDNPTRIGIFVKKVSKGFECTNGNGLFWVLNKDNDRLKVIGRIHIPNQLN